eukprot:904191-Prymnesium_polylepis.1
MLDHSVARARPRRRGLTTQHDSATPSARARREVCWDRPHTGADVRVTATQGSPPARRGLGKIVRTRLTSGWT